MKTAIKFGLVSMASLCAFAAGPAAGQAMLAETSVTTSMTSTQTSSVAPKMAKDMAAVTSPKVDPPDFDSENEKSGKGDKNDMSSPKMPESVKTVVKHLNATTGNITLDDLNSAREAVAKLDILIDIEKRLSDLATIRQEREEKSFAAAIPASALGVGRRAQIPAAMLDTSPVASAPAPMPIVLPAANVEIVRIAGAGGRYTATVKISDGKSMLVHEGDKLSDGSVVQAISSKSVTLLKDKKTRTVNVKDVAVVFNGRT